MIDPSAPPASSSAVPRPDHAKRLFGLLVFIAIVGGWLGYTQYRDKRAPLPGADVAVGPCTLWFVGSSSIARWSSLDNDMRPWAAVNRGVLGAPLTYIEQHFRNEPPGRHPLAVVLYGGDNDIAEGLGAAEAADAMEALIRQTRGRLGPVPIFVISLKPSPTRWEQLKKQAAYNAALRRFAARHRDVYFVNTVPRLLVDGRPGPFYEADGLHLNDRGYAIWARSVRESLISVLPPAVHGRCGNGRSPEHMAGADPALSRDAG